MLFTWLKFILAATVIFWAGKRLTHLSNDLAERLGLTKGWVGLIVLALITSLPEAATSGGAAFLGNADVSIGNVLGSNVFNLTFLGLLTLLVKPDNLWDCLGYEQVLTAKWLIVLTLLVVLGLLMPVAIGGISLAGVLILAVSLLGMHNIYLYHQEQERTHTPKADTGMMYLLFFVFSILVVAGGLIVARTADEIAIATGLSHTFVGSVFAAVVTSLPETTVSYHALKMGELDMAASNLLGSNLINTTLIFLSELLYTQGAIFAHASGGHLLTCASLLFLTGIVLFCIHYALPNSAFSKASPWVMSAVYLNYLWFLA